MRNFLAFLRQFRVILFLALLQGIALTWIISVKEYQRAQVWDSTNRVTGTTYSWLNEMKEFIHLKENNDWLQDHIAELESKQVKNFLKVDRETIKINDTTYKVQYAYVPAEIVKSSHTYKNNYFTINVGEKNGIKKDMGVFGVNGVVGTIYRVNDYYSIVKSCLTENINIAAMIEGSGEHGFLKWDGNDARRGTLTGISNDREVKKWSKVITRGSAGTFPKGLPIGKVESTKSIEGKPLWDVKVLFAEDYRRIQRVFVIKNLLRDEQLDLEKGLNDLE